MKQFLIDKVKLMSDEDLTLTFDILTTLLMKSAKEDMKRVFHRYRSSSKITKQLLADVGVAGKILYDRNKL